MSIKRYRVRSHHWVNGKGWTPIPNSDNNITTLSQKHKRGGWCKWEDVKRLESNKDAKIKAFMEGLDIQNIDEFMEKADVENYRQLGAEMKHSIMRRIR